MVRRILILAADHGHEPSALAVRALASTGVTPWRAVLGGLSVTIGRNSKSNEFDAINRLLVEIVASLDPRAVIVQRIRIGDPLPGFDSGVYPDGDPRANALLRHCAQVFGGEKPWRRLQTALDTVRETKDLQPTFALASIFAAQQVGLGPRASFFHLGRTAGWVAHAIEQYHAGDGR
jgi:citrate synthase